MLQGIKAVVVPKLERGKFARLAQRLVWAHASPTCDLPGGPGEAQRGKKEPDTALMMMGRALPTIVFEVGYSESRAKLRTDARRWLETGRDLGGGLKRKRGNERLEPVMLVVLISFEGKRPSEDGGVDYTEVDYDAPGQLKALEIYVEMWRLMPVADMKPTTRSNQDAGLNFAPTMCEREQFFPSADGAVTVYLTDLLGVDNVDDPSNRVKYRIPLRVFLMAYQERLSMFARKKDIEEGKAEYGDRIGVSSADEDDDDDDDNDGDRSEGRSDVGRNVEKGGGGSDVEQGLKKDGKEVIWNEGGMHEERGDALIDKGGVQAVEMIAEDRSASSNVAKRRKV